MACAVIALGSNLGRRRENLRNALAAMDRLCGTHVAGVSCLYDTAPDGYMEQPRFLNAAAVIYTTLSPHALLGACLGIESALGRVRERQNGPRTVDIDLLVYENIVCSGDELTLPHPRIKQRAFVLAPVLDLFPDGQLPGLDLSCCLPDMAQRMRDAGVIKIKKADTWG